MLQKYLNTLRRKSYTELPLIEDCVTATRDSAEVHVEAFAVLQKYLNILRRDSYTKQPHR